jgi:hypothetical protein
VHSNLLSSPWQLGHSWSTLHYFVALVRFLQHDGERQSRGISGPWPQVVSTKRRERARAHERMHVSGRCDEFVTWRIVSMISPGEKLEQKTKSCNLRPCPELGQLAAAGAVWAHSHTLDQSWPATARTTFVSFCLLFLRTGRCALACTWRARPGAATDHTVVCARVRVTRSQRSQARSE